ncbi:MAG TPA: bifunctional DNA-formamidopyrimidine glycosylase/DNA-(apurinic or apyrimidinic site) lyase [Candidatus Paceibacterota bacterium]|nr:bifunctional DNA-formamidopyrimidine glycosylase/DNA-(apurinic or apyrimidinic site) lyase [Candidatus Paceibacterota bacterium]
MPELPEVTTTANKLNEILPGQKIISVWTNYNSNYFKGKKNIKDPKYFDFFKKEVIKTKIENVSRIGKNVLINISGPKTILIHMKMTGHLLYGDYKFVRDKRGGVGDDGGKWVATMPGPLQDKFNQYIRVVFQLSGGKKLVLSDVRKFAKVTLIPDGNISNFEDTKKLGPNPLSNDFNLTKFKSVISKKPNGKIKSVLMDQEIISGIGNIYSDEALWLSGIHPEQKVCNINTTDLKFLLKNIKKVLNLGIDFGGDSTSDYRQPDGRPGNFQNKHQVYRRKGKKCGRRGCGGTIIRKVVGGRSAHFCDTHQKLTS